MLKEHKDLKVLQVERGQLVHKDLREQQVLLERRERLVLKVHQVLKDLWDL